MTCSQFSNAKIELYLADEAVKKVERKINDLSGKNFKVLFLKIKRKGKSVENLYEKLKNKTELKNVASKKLSLLFDDLFEEME